MGETRGFFTLDSLVLSEFLHGVRMFLCFLCNVGMLRNEVILTALTFCSGSLVYNKHGGFCFFFIWLLIVIYLLAGWCTETYTLRKRATKLHFFF